MIKKFNNLIFAIFYRFNAINKIRIEGKNNSITKKGRIEGLTILIVGNNNKIIFESNSVVQYSTIKIFGDNHTFHVHQNCDIQKNEIWIQGQSNQFIIGENSMLVHSDIAVGENGTKLIIGKNCMVAGEIRTSDGHSILNENGKRVNFGEDILIEDKVWVCKGSMVLKGVHIGAGSMVAARSIVTKNIPPKSMVAGAPAKIIRENIGWNKALI